MTYFIQLKKLYLFLRQNKMLFSKDSKCLGKCLEKFLKLGIFVLATDRNCLEGHGTVNVILNKIIFSGKTIKVIQ